MIRQTLATIALGLSCSVGASNPAFQDFFFSVCQGAQGELALRCAETDGGLGNLSASSETSLNPNQALSSPGASLGDAQQRGEMLRDRLHHDALSERVEIGRFALLLNAYPGSDELSLQANRDPERSFKVDRRSADVGVDYRISDSLNFGAWLHWQSDQLTFEREAQAANFEPFARAGQIDSNGRGISLYLAAAMGTRGYIDLSIGQMSVNQDLVRAAIFQESKRLVPQTDVITTASTEVSTRFAHINAGYTWETKGWQFSPYTGVSVQRFSGDDYVETERTSSGLAMAVQVEDTSSATGFVGLRLTRAWSIEGAVLFPQLTLEYKRAFERDDVGVSARFVNDSHANQLLLAASRRDQNSFDFGLGITALLPHGWMPYFEYRTSIGIDNLQRDRFSIGLRKEL